MASMNMAHMEPKFETKYSSSPRSQAARVPSPSEASSSYQHSQLPLYHSLCTGSSSPPSSPVYLNPAPHYPAAVSRTPTSSQSSRSPRPCFEGDVLDADWFEPSPRQPQHPLSSSALQAQTRNMSAVAVQYDLSFDMGTKSSYTWPGSEHINGLTGHDLGHYSSDASMTPPSGSRSLTGSPPRSVHGLSAEQRELKRQRDQARRDTKLQARVQRTGSSSSSVYSPTPSMVDLHLTTGASSMPMYATAPSSHSQTNQLILMVDPPTSSYLSPSFSPPLPTDQSQAGMYQSAYSTQSYMNYPTYTSTSGPNMASQFGYVETDHAGHLGPAADPVHRRPLLGDPGLAMYHPTQQVMSDPGPDVGAVRVVQSRPKPQCWEHGCNGRQFSTFSNLLRHQREKSGQAAKAVCPNCGAQFTRTTARNGHLLHDKCKSKGSGET